MPTNAIASSILPLHILGGVLALVFGYTALYTTKGGRQALQGIVTIRAPHTPVLEKI
jgi:hypothetical protein